MANKITIDKPGVISRRTGFGVETFYTGPGPKPSNYDEIKNNQEKAILSSNKSRLITIIE